MGFISRQVWLWAWASPVIFTCRHDMLDKLHFDTRQYNHIVWTGPEDLNERLRLRIEARIT